MVKSAELIDDILRLFPGNCPWTRPVHTHGIGGRGTFRASSVAASYSRAAHFTQPKVDVAVRFSNGSGLPIQRDSLPDVRGMAVRFFVNGDHSDWTDLISMTLPVFFTPTVPEFRAFAAASIPRPRPKQSRLTKLIASVMLAPPIAPLDPGVTTSGDLGALAYADAHHSSCPAVLGMAAPVTGSYAGATYHAVHAFELTATDGTQRFVRFSWESEGGQRVHSSTSEVYLFDDLRRRVAAGRASFVLRAQVAESGDDLTDPTRAWPMSRRRLTLGRLVVDEIPDDQATGCEDLEFDPGRMVDGIALSADPVLRAREAVYAASAARRKRARTRPRP